MKKLLGTAVLAAVCAMSNQAIAAPVALDGSIATALSTGTYNATFSGTAFLPADYTINSLKYSFTFRDDPSDPWTTSQPKHDRTTSTGYYVESGIFNVTYGRDVDIYQTIQRTGERESVQLSLAGLLVGSGATAQSVTSATSDASKRVYDGSDCYFFCDYYYSNTTTHTTTVTTDWTGTFTISGTVSSKEILDKLLQDDQLLVSLKVDGDLKLTGASLLLDYTATQVPEPSSILLALAGLGGLGFARRRTARA
ncbi:PEP-CTERM sorting domain-containing protein [uncultured Massilia sp.]|uniref:PEP-CTERM sorting domain-containing protein n=1 Tax=uncultured Massilia sp. TaxID=169973 RepID=UPI0025CF6FD4|nr:PEP-CTERM sorting domain-containing protein [uncultured Massilia sp.]